MPTDPLLSSLLAPARVRIGLDAATKADVLRAVVALAATSPAVADAAALLADVEAREATLSTGVGEGLALPHARSAAVLASVAALATLAAPVEYDALDGAPVGLVLLLAGPLGDPGAHVRLLAHVSRLMSRAGVRARLLASTDADDFCAALAEAEAAMG